MIRLRVCATILFQVSLVFYSQPLSSQSPDGGKQQSEAERGAMLFQQLKEAKTQMDLAFNEAIQFLSPTAEDAREYRGLPADERARQIKWDKRMMRDLRASQQAWVAYRNASCLTVLDFYAEGSGAGNASTGCDLELTTARTEFLRQNFSIHK
jgi:uncharacterized protein YecT (DUF1311 family)